MWTHSKLVKNSFSNAEYYNFVLDNGYDREEFWTQEGWNWASGQKNKYPKFWINTSQEGHAP